MDNIKDKIKDYMHWLFPEGSTEGEGVQPDIIAHGYGQPCVDQPTAEGGHEKKGMFFFRKHHEDDQEGGKKKGDYMFIGSSSSSSSDKVPCYVKAKRIVTSWCLCTSTVRAQRKVGAAGGTAGTTTGTTTVPLEGGEKKHGFVG